MSSAVFLVSAPLTVFNNTGAGGSIIEWGKETWQHNTAIRFAVSGIMGNAFFFAIDRALFPIIINTASRFSVSNVSKWMIQNAASVSFFVAYLLDIAIQRKCRFVVSLTDLSTYTPLQYFIVHYRPIQCLAGVWFAND